MPSLITDIIGQVERLPLKPSMNTAMLPMFETVNNALHALTDQYGDKDFGQGKICIEVDRNGDGEPISLSVLDNGVGLDSANYASFCTPHSTHKIKRGGKGLGRLSWLKINQSAHVESRYIPLGDDGKRVFDFQLKPENQIEELDDEPTHVPTQTGTYVLLMGFLDEYQGLFPKKSNEVALALIRHFLPLFAGDKCPTMKLIDGEPIDLKFFFQSLIKESNEEIIEVEIAHLESNQADCETIQIHHMRCNKSVASTIANGKNSLCFCAHGRGVEEIGIDKQIGQGILSGETVYVGALTGDFLDAHVNAERTRFNYSNAEKQAIRTALTESIAKFLEKDFQTFFAKKQVTLNQLIKKRPSLKSVLKEGVESAVRNKIPFSLNSEEEMYRYIVLEGYRQENRRKVTLNSLLEGDSLSEEARELAIKLVEDHTMAQKNALTEYVLNRKVIIELFERSLGENITDSKHFYEKIVHQLICPMGVSKGEISYSDHNLWLVDDRFSYSSFFTSDKQIRAFTDNPSAKEPDISIFYDNPQTWQLSKDNFNTLIIVEFKRPGRDDYDGNTNPMRQVSKYIDDLLGGEMKDVDGKVIDQINDKTNIFAYIIADLTPTLRGELKGFGPTFDGDGLFLHSASNPRAYIEVLPYKKLLKDAKVRNRAFFETLSQDAN